MGGVRARSGRLPLDVIRGWKPVSRKRSCSTQSMINKKETGFPKRPCPIERKLDHDPTEHGLAAHGEDCPTNCDARRRCRCVAGALVAGRIGVISASRAVVIIRRGGCADRGRTDGCRANSGSDAPSGTPASTRVTAVPDATAPRAAAINGTTMKACAAMTDTAAEGESVAGKARNAQHGRCGQHDDCSIRHGNCPFLSKG
jgi:hypothetical protein